MSSSTDQAFKEYAMMVWRMSSEAGRWGILMATCELLEITTLQGLNDALTASIGDFFKFPDELDFEGEQQLMKDAPSFLSQDAFVVAGLLRDSILAIQKDADSKSRGSWSIVHPDVTTAALLTSLVFAGFAYEDCGVLPKLSYLILQGAIEDATKSMAERN